MQILSDAVLLHLADLPKTSCSSRLRSEMSMAAQVIPVISPAGLHTSSTVKISKKCLAPPIVA